MPIPTVFHSRTAPLVESYEWRAWAGYMAASTYEHSHEREYYAIRNTVALIDVTPLFKYELRGPDAQRLVDRIITRDAARCAVGQVLYTSWCDDDGKVIDDGTVHRLGAEHFRVTSAESNLAWFQDCAIGMEVSVVDVTDELAALAVQGPNARAVLNRVIAGVDLDQLKYYRTALGYLANGGEIFPVRISRTGYTGDLGFELWLAPEHAIMVWDRLVEDGLDFGLLPAGMVALDIARIEAGLLMIQVDYISARSALIEAQKSSPFEIGLGWSVDLTKADFVGRRALLDEKRRGSSWKFVGLEVDWESIQTLYENVDLAPHLAGRASRQAIPVYQGRRQVGQSTSHTFSPLLKKYIALTTLETAAARPGTQVQLEMTVEYVRRRANATVVKLPFFNPPRKRSLAG